MNVQQYLDYINDDRAAGYLLSQQHEQTKISVSTEFIRVCHGNAYDAILLSQIVFWYGINPKTKQPRVQHKFNGDYWIVKTHDEWATELQFNSGRTIGQCLKRLADEGLIIKERHKSPYHDAQVVSFVRLNWTEFINKMSGSDSGSTYHVEPESTQHSEPESTYHVEPIPETTTETTTEVIAAEPQGEKPEPVEDELKPEKTTTPHQDMFGAIVDAMGWQVDHLTKTNRGLVGKVAKELLEVSATPDELQPLRDYCASLFDKFSVAALTKYYPEWKATMNSKQHRKAEIDPAWAKRVKEMEQETNERFKVIRAEALAKLEEAKRSGKQSTTDVNKVIDDLADSWGA